MAGCSAPSFRLARRDSDIGGTSGPETDQGSMARAQPSVSRDNHNDLRLPYQGGRRIRRQQVARPSLLRADGAPWWPATCSPPGSVPCSPERPRALPGRATMHRRDADIFDSAPRPARPATTCAGWRSTASSRRSPSARPAASAGGASPPARETCACPPRPARPRGPSGAGRGRLAGARPMYVRLYAPPPTTGAPSPERRGPTHAAQGVFHGNCRVMVAAPERAAQEEACRSS